jgi:DNA invertase Pin-like site-specific DNA recombinase
MGKKYKRINKEILEKMQQMHKKGFSLPAIAEELGLSIFTVYTYLRYGGHPSKHKLKKEWKENLDKKIEEMRKRRMNGESLSRIASDMGISIYFVWKHTNDIKVKERRGRKRKNS